MVNKLNVQGVFEEYSPGIWICTLCRNSGKNFKIISDPAGVHKNSGKKRAALTLDIGTHMSEEHSGKS